MLLQNRNSGGAVRKIIDFDVLRQELSDCIVEGPEERYQFTWPDKRKSILAANAPINKTLRPCREESVNFDTTENLYIEGDNLEVLKLLQETYLGKVKMIYIDPPYNTGNDFVYNDDFKQKATDYLENSGQYDEDGNQMVQNTESNGRFHTDWLNMMYPRLKLAKDLLADDGVIFISIDDNEQVNLKKLCDEVFGDTNFINQVIWVRNSSGKTVSKKLTVNIEYLLIYSKSTEYELNPVFKPLSESTKKLYSKDDGDGRGKYRLYPLQKPSNPGPETTYDYVDNTGKIWKCPPKGWRINKDKLKALENDGRLCMNNTTLSEKAYWNERTSEGRLSDTYWDDVPENNIGTKDFNILFGDSNLFDNPKPIEYLKKILKAQTAADTDDIILDFFSGSATTAHAVMQLNAEDGGKRMFIMVQLPELTDEKSEAYKAGYKNICEIGKERIRRAGKKILEEHPDAKDLDIGFRVLKCDSSNMEDVYYTPADYMKKEISLFVDNVKTDRSAEDLLFQCMLELDTPLSSSIEVQEIGGKTVYNVAGGHLMACFDTDVTDEVVTEIAKLQPSYFVLRDSSMADDSVAANFEQIFKTYSPHTERRVL